MSGHAYVVINREDREEVERLTRAIDAQFKARGWSYQDDLDAEVIDCIQAALRTFGEES